MQIMTKSAQPNYVWIVVGLVFLMLLTAAGIRATPSVMILPLEHEFGWSRTTISFVISINIALYGLIGPFSAAAMQRYGIRPIVLGAMALFAIGTSLSVGMTMPWHMMLAWGGDCRCRQRCNRHYVSSNDSRPLVRHATWSCNGDLNCQRGYRSDGVFTLNGPHGW